MVLAEGSEVGKRQEGFGYGFESRSPGKVV
jgi:hypothetical protein